MDSCLMSNMSAGNLMRDSPSSSGSGRGSDSGSLSSTSCISTSSSPSSSSSYASSARLPSTGGQGAAASGTAVPVITPPGVSPSADVRPPSTPLPVRIGGVDEHFWLCGGPGGVPVRLGAGKEGGRVHRAQLLDALLELYCSCFSFSFSRDLCRFSNVSYLRWRFSYAASDGLLRTHIGDAGAYGMCIDGRG